MSDFGVIIKFTKNSGELQASDLENIISALEEIVGKSNDFPSNIVEGNYLTLKKWEGNTYVSVITEYYLDENEQELREWASEEDIAQALDITQKLSLIFNDIQMSVHLEDW